MSVAGVSDSEWGAYAAWSRRELQAKVAASTLDVRQLLASGAMEGPYRREPNRIAKELQRRQGQAREFRDLYAAYRRANTRRDAAKIAFGIAFRGLPF